MPDVLESGRLKYVVFLIDYRELYFMLCLSTFCTAVVGVFRCTNELQHDSAIPAFQLYGTITTFFYCTIRH